MSTGPGFGHEYLLKLKQDEDRVLEGMRRAEGVPDDRFSQPGQTGDPETIKLAVIEGLGDQPRGVENSSFVVRLVDDDLEPTGDQFEVYARIQTETENYDLNLCTPHYKVGGHLDIRRASYPIGGLLYTHWFAEGTFQSTDCECD